MTSDIAFIRSHRFGEVEDRLATQLEIAFGAGNVALCVDESRGPVDTGRWPKASLTRDRAEGMVGGTVPDDWGWRMGDLCHIAIAEDFGPRRHQWLIESDVHVPAGQEDAIFGRLNAITADFMACALRPKKVKPMAVGVATALPSAGWGCIFALNRLSGRHVPAVRQLRRDIRAAIAAGAKVQTPNDEAVLANLGVALDWTMVDLWAAMPDMFSHRWFDTNPPSLRRELDAQTGSLRVSHPVLEVDQVFRRLEAPRTEGHPQAYKVSRLGRILAAMTPEEKARVMKHLQPASDTGL